MQSEGRPIESSSIKRFLRISRKYHKHQIFVIVEEEDPSLPTMKISNQLSSGYIAVAEIYKSSSSLILNQCSKSLKLKIVSVSSNDLILIDGDGYIYNLGRFDFVHKFKEL